MSAIIKEKNIIKFQVGENKTYSYDMNAGVIYGLKGAALRNIPSVVRHLITENRQASNVIYYLSQPYFGGGLEERFTDTEHILFYDSLDSMGFPVFYDIPSCYIPVFKRHIKELHKDFVEDALDVGFLNNKLHDYKFEDWLVDNGLKIDEHFTREKASFLYKCKFPEKWNARLAYYLCRGGLWEFFNSADEFGRGLTVLESRFASFIDMMTRLGRTPEKGDFIRQFSEVQAEYLLRKDEIDREILYKNQFSHANALQFSYGNFEVVIPITTQEFINEGDNQGNCVARIYLPKVLRGETNVVFVRKKDALNTSYITCEVRCGKIAQFLLRYNQPILADSPEADFYKAYAAHLSKNWGK